VTDLNLIEGGLEARRRLNAGERLTEAGNARRFARRYAGEVRYCADEDQWWLWKGRLWERDVTGEIMQLAKEMIRDLYAEAADEPDEARRAELARWAQRSESAKAIREMLYLARSEPRIAARTSDFDTHPSLLNFENGTLNLDTFELEEQDPDHLLTKMAPVPYDQTARSTRWDEVLAKAQSDEDGRRFLQKAAGYTLDGRKREDVLLCIFGPTRTAKGTVTESFANSLGDYAMTAELDALAERSRAGGPRPELVRLRGARMVSIYETGRKLKLDAALVKSITGSDPITARRLYAEPVTFKPQFVLWIASNYRPSLPEDDAAVWERVREIPFTIQIPEHERDPRVRAELSDPKQHGAAIMAWAVEGLRMLREEGFAPPEVVRAATREYRAEMDVAARFLSERCEFDPEAWTLAAELHEEFARWCRENDEILRGAKLTDGLRENGCERKKRFRGHGWVGVQLVGAEE
jgi:putative DNA primase/helicase